MTCKIGYQAGPVLAAIVAGDEAFVVATNCPGMLLIAKGQDRAEVGMDIRGMPALTTVIGRVKNEADGTAAFADVEGEQAMVAIKKMRW